MTTEIKQNKMFNTPDSMESLQDWIERLNGQERVVAYTAAGMAWNLAAKLVGDKNTEEDIKE
jgi:hypothetical protein